jgi:BlaI family penicillinase repressor
MSDQPQAPLPSEWPAKIMAKQKRSKAEHEVLSRRERQFLDVIYRLNEATANQVLEQLPDPPSYSAVRATLALLEKKGHLKHRREGVTYVYGPVVAPTNARTSAMRHLMRTFFDGSAMETVAALLDQESRKLSDEDFDRLEEMIEEARRQKR